MTAECETCGRPAENGTPAHWLGCEQVMPQDFEAKRVHVDFQVICEHDECSEPKKEWSGRGARPKYCADGHK